MRRWLALLAAAALLGGCGGEGGSEDEAAATADEYRSALDAACQERDDVLTGLPQKAQEEGLTIDEVQELARQDGERFVGEVESLRPPAELEQGHATLLDALHAGLPDEGDLDAVRAYTAGFTGIYADLGAKRCEALQRKAVKSIQRAQASPSG